MKFPALGSLCCRVPRAGLAPWHFPGEDAAVGAMCVFYVQEGVVGILGCVIPEERGDSPVPGTHWLGLSIPAAAQLPTSTGDQSMGFQLENIWL